MKRLSIIVPISIFLIFVLLFNAFKSVKSALLILVNVPLGLIGGIFALLLTGHSVERFRLPSVSLRCLARPFSMAWSWSVTLTSFRTRA